MLNSNYPEPTRREIIEAGLKGYYNMLEGEVNGLKRVNEPAAVGLYERGLKKYTSKENWYKLVHMEEMSPCSGSGPPGPKVVTSGPGGQGQWRVPPSSTDEVLQPNPQLQNKAGIYLKPEIQTRYLQSAQSVLRRSSLSLLPPTVNSSRPYKRRMTTSPKYMA